MHACTRSNSTLLNTRVLLELKYKIIKCNEYISHYKSLEMSVLKMKTHLSRRSAFKAKVGEYERGADCTPVQSQPWTLSILHNTNDAVRYIYLSVIY